MTDPSGATITGTFNTRRQAEVAVEHLVQELKIERTDIFVVPDGAENSSGETVDGADAESGHSGVDPSSDPALAGGITVSVDLAEDDKLARVRLVLEEFGGKDIAAE